MPGTIRRSGGNAVVTTVADLRETLRKGGITVGSWMQLPNDSVAQLMGAAGFDWIALDLEHGRFSEASLPSLFAVIEAGGTLPFVRLGEVSAFRIKAALDAGAKGLILPMIESVDALRAAISWANYPPRGTRGVGYSRANLFGKQFAEGIRAEPPLIVAQIEHVSAVRELDAILSAEGLDAVMVGPYDLSASMGMTGQFDAPQFSAAMSTVVETCRKRGIASGLHVVLPDDAAFASAVAEGHRFIAYGTDAVFLWKNAAPPPSHSKVRTR